MSKETHDQGVAELRRLADEAEALTKESGRIYIGEKSMTPLEAIHKLIEATRIAADRIERLEKRFELLPPLK